jgi:uncharacterized cupin superfamily protein
MRKVNLSEISELRRQSPKGKYGSVQTQISIALGREPDALDLAKRHPFDLTLVRLPPGNSRCPFHAHSAQWELYLIISGQATVRDETGSHTAGAGDSFMFPPGEAHQIINHASEDLVYYVIADNPIGECWYYPGQPQMVSHRHRRTHHAQA